MAEWLDVDGAQTKKFVLFTVTSEMDGGVISVSHCWWCSLGASICTSLYLAVACWLPVILHNSRIKERVSMTFRLCSRALNLRSFNK